MFPLDDGRLIRLNKDGTNGEIIQTKKPKITFGTSIVHDHFIKDVDAGKEVTCEISTDDYGRVLIYNKSPNEILVNGKPITSTRPLLNNSIIKVCDGVEFRWIYKSAKENISAEYNDADFASWSDPAKKHMKQSRLQKQRPKGRLTEHAIHLYSSAIEDIAEKRELSAILDDEPNTGCSVISTDTKTLNNPEGNNSSALINFSMNKDQSDIGTQPTVGEIVEKPVECGSMDESAIKSQPSNCSIVTLSSEESDEAAVHDISNHKNNEFKDDELFERSISCPPIELQDDLFENSQLDDGSDVIENQKKLEDDMVNDENMDISESSMQNINETNMSIDRFASNEDFVIPETQDVMSQDSIASPRPTNTTAVHRNQSDVGQISGLEQSQSNLSVVSISSYEDNSQIEVPNDMTKLDENRSEIGVKFEASTTSSDGESIQQSRSNAEFNESDKLLSQSLFDAFNDSTINTKEQSQTIPTGAQLNTTQDSGTSIDRQDNIANSTISAVIMHNNRPNEAGLHEVEFDLSRAQQIVNASTVASTEKSFTCTNSDKIIQSNGKMIHSPHVTEPNGDGCVPTATSSCISSTDNNVTQQLNDTTQELNLDALNSDVEEIDTLEYTSSNSSSSSDSGNITANTSSAITTENVSANQSADTCQISNSLTMKSEYEMHSIDKPSVVMDAISAYSPEMADSKDGQSLNVECESNQDHPEPTSTPHELFKKKNVIQHTNCTLELSSSCDASTTGSSIFKAHADISVCNQSQENIVLTSNEGVVAEPSHDYVESAQNIYSMATSSTPARRISIFDTCLNLNQSIQPKAAHFEIEEPMSISSTTGLKIPENDITVEDSEMEDASATAEYDIQSTGQNNENELVSQSNEDDAVITTPPKIEIITECRSTVSRSTRRNRTIREIASFTPKKLDNSFADDASSILQSTQTNENKEPSQSDDAQQSHTIIMAECPCTVDAVNAEAIEASSDLNQAKECIESDLNDSVQSTPECDSELQNKYTSVCSTKRKQLHLEIDTSTSLRTPQKLNTSVALDPGSKLKTPLSRNKNFVDGKTTTVVALESSPTVNELSSDMSNEKTVKPITDECIFLTPSEINVNIRSTANLTAPRSTQSNRIFLEMQTYTPKLPSKNLDVTFAQGTPQKLDDAQQALEEIGKPPIQSQSVNEQNQEMVEEIPASQFTDEIKILSSSVSESKLHYSSVSVQSTCRKRLHVGNETLTDQKTPQKLQFDKQDGDSPINVSNIEMLTEYPTTSIEQIIDRVQDNSDEQKLSTAEEEHTIEASIEMVPKDDANLIGIASGQTTTERKQQELRKVVELAPTEIGSVIEPESTQSNEAGSGTNEVCSTSAKIDVATKDISTSLRSSINISECTPKKMDNSEVKKHEIEEMQHEVVTSIASESETDAEQCDNVESHDDADDEIPSTQIESSDSMLSTPMCDPKLRTESTSVRSTSQKSLHLSIEAPIGRQTPRKLNASIALHTPTNKLNMSFSKLQKTENIEVGNEKTVEIPPELSTVIEKSKNDESEENEYVAKYDDSKEKATQSTFENTTPNEDIDTAQQNSEIVTSIASECESTAEQNENVEFHREVDDEIPATQIESSDSMLSTPMCNPELRSESTSVRSTRRKQLHLAIEAPVGRRTPRKLNAIIALQTPTNKLKMSSSQLEKTDNIEVGNDKTLETPSELQTVTEKLNNDESDGNDTPKNTTPNKNIDTAQQNSEIITLVASGSETDVEQCDKVESHDELDDEISATHIESNDSILATPLCDRKLQSELTHARSIKRKQPHLLCDTLTKQRTPQKLNCSVQLDTSGKLETSSSQLEKTKNIEVGNEKTIEIPPELAPTGIESIIEPKSTQSDEADSGTNEVCSTSDKIDVATKDIATSLCSSINISECTPKKMDNSEVMNTPQKHEIEEMQHEVPEIVTSIASESETDAEQCDNVESHDDADDEIPSFSKLQKTENIEVGNEKTVEIPPELSTVIEKSKNDASEGNEYVDKYDDSKEKATQSTFKNTTPNEDIDTAQQNSEIVTSIASECKSTAEQNENVEFHDEVDDEIATKISTPMCNPELRSESTSVRSTRRKQLHLAIEAPVGRRTPRKLNTSIALHTPTNKLKMSSSQLEKTENIEVGNDKTFDMPPELQTATEKSENDESEGNESVAKYDDSEEKAPQSTFENTTPNEDIDTAQQNSEIVTSIASESESTAEQNENVEFHSEVDDEIPATQVESSDSMLSTPMCDPQLRSKSTSVRSNRQKHLHLVTEAPIGRRTPRKLNVSLQLDTPAKLKTTTSQIEKTKNNAVENNQSEENESVREYDDSKEKAPQTKNVTPKEEIDEVQQNSEIATSIASESESSAEQNENVEFHDEVDDEIATKISTPMCNPELRSESTSVRSTRRKQLHLAIEEPVGRRTPRKLNTSIALHTPTNKLKMSSSQLEKTENIEVGNDKTFDMPPELQTATEKSKNDESEGNEAVAMYGGSKKNAPHLIPENMTPNEDIDIAQPNSEITTPISSESETDPEQNDNIESHGKADDGVPHTPVRNPKLQTESTSVRSTRRNPANLAMGTPNNRRTPRVLNVSVALDTPGQLKTPLRQDKIQDNTLTQSSQPKQPQNDIDMPTAKLTHTEIDVACELNTSSVPLEVTDKSAAVDKKFGNINIVKGYSIELQESLQFDAESSASKTDETNKTQKSEESIVPVPIIDSVPSIQTSLISLKKEPTKASNITIIIPRIGTPEIRKLTRGYIQQSPDSSESTDAQPTSHHTANSNIRTTRRKQPILESEANTSFTVPKLVSTVQTGTDLIESSPMSNAEIIKNGNKRVGTPLPSNRKRVFHKNEKSSKNKESDIETAPQTNSEEIDSGSKSKCYDEAVTTKTGRSLRQKKLKNDTMTSTTEETAADQNSTLDATAATAADGENKLEMPSNSDSQKSKEPVVKASRHKRAKVTENASIESDKITPMPVKSQLAHIAVETTATPNSTRSLRSRAIIIDESSTVTPKRTRNQNKADQSDNKPIINTDDVQESSNKDSAERPVPQEKMEKQKRQSGRNVNATQAINEEQSEIALEQVDEQKSNKRTAKRTRLMSIELRKVTANIPSSTENLTSSGGSQPKPSSSVTQKNNEESTGAKEIPHRDTLGEMDTENKPNRTTKRTKAKSTEIDSEKEATMNHKNVPATSDTDTKVMIDGHLQDNQVEKKTKRTKAKKVETETLAAVASSETPTKKRTLRDRTASICSNIVPEQSTSEVSEKKRRLRDRTGSVFVDNAPKLTTTEEPIKSKSTRRNAVTSSASDSASTTKEVDEKAKTDNQPENKSKRGTKRAANDDTVAVAQTPPKKRNLRPRTVSKSQENLSTVTEPTKPKVKRGRKADADVLAEVEEPSFPPAKRTRNIKKTKDTEVESEPSKKETPPISTRTRQRK